MRPALLIVDVQNAFFKDPASARSLERAVEGINAAIDLFRRRDLPVIVIQHMDEEGGLIPGSDDFAVPGSLNLSPADLRITKTSLNSFHRTELAGKLRALGVDTAIVTGYCAEYCVLATYRGAEEEGFKAMFLRGALASGDPQRLRFVEEIGDLISLGALRAVLG